MGVGVGGWGWGWGEFFGNNYVSGKMDEINNWSQGKVEINILSTKEIEINLI